MIRTTVFTAILLVFCILLADALEYEVSGACRNCLLLDKLRPSIGDNHETRGAGF